jgi:hypothetical protein
MSEETARIYARARQRGVSAAEAWANMRELAEEYDWDVEQMLSDSDAVTHTVSDRELPQ